jgi:hypothetical protein
MLPRSVMAFRENAVQVTFTRLTFTSGPGGVICPLTTTVDLGTDKPKNTANAMGVDTTRREMNQQ